MYNYTISQILLRLEKRSISNRSSSSYFLNRTWIHRNSNSFQSIHHNTRQQRNVFRQKFHSTTRNTNNNASNTQKNNSRDSVHGSVSWREQIREVFADLKRLGDSGLWKRVPVRETKSNEASKLAAFGGFKRLFRLAKPQAALIALALACQVVNSSAIMTFPLAVGRIIDIVEHPELTSQLRLIVGGLFFIFSVASVAVVIRVSLMSIVGERIAQHLRKALFNTIMKQDIHFFDKSLTGELVNRLSADTSTVAKLLTENLTRTVRSSVTTTSALGCVMYFSPKLSLVALCVLPPTAILAKYFGRVVRTLAQQFQDSLASATQVAAERFSAIRTVRLFGAEDRESSRYARRIDESFSLAQRVSIAEGLYLGGGFLLTQTTLIGVLCYGSTLVTSGELTVGGLTSFTMYAVNLGFGVSNLATAYGQLTRAQGSAARVFQLLDQKPSGEFSATSSNAASNCIVRGAPNYVANIRFDSVSFAYPSRPKIQVLDGLSFETNPGEVVAIAGASGSGKSTIINLLARFYEPDQGQIFLSDTPISTLNPRWLRSQYGVVPQEPVFFEGSIRDNILYGFDQEMLGSESLDQWLNQSLEWSSSNQFVHSLRDGLDTHIGERGLNLSGGQRQRLALARALLRRPKILILDELTAQLDSESEAQVSGVIRQMTMEQGLSVLIIAHRLSTLRSSDRILVLNHGHVAESGSYTQLSHRNGLLHNYILASTRNQTVSQHKDSITSTN